MPEADVVVLGAGPAGTAAAITAAQRGLRVVVLEAANRPRDRPGETLHPGVEPLFEQLGVAAAVRAASFLRHRGIHVGWQGAARFVPYGGGPEGPWLGFQAWRSALDTILQDQAARLGARVEAGRRVTRLCSSGRRLTGVEIAGRPLAAKWVVDATGDGQWLAHRAGLDIVHLSPRLLVYYGYVRRPSGEAPRLQATGAGWTWLAEVRPGLYQWTQLPFDRSARLESVAGEAASRTRAADVTWRWVPKSAGPGYFLVGDAAAVLDPSSSHGVLRALMSGILAGHSIARVVGGAWSEPDACAYYRGWLREWIEHDVRAMKELYGELPRPPAWIDAGGAS